MNFSTLFKAYDAVVAFRDATRRFKGLSSEPPPPETSLSPSAAAQGIAGQIETRLTNVVVAALKEAFDRDHARLELERAQVEEQQRRAEEALRLELRRQAIDREWHDCACSQARRWSASSPRSLSFSSTSPACRHALFSAPAGCSCSARSGRRSTPRGG